MIRTLPHILLAACLTTFLFAADPSLATEEAVMPQNAPPDSSSIEKMEELQRLYPYDEGLRRRLVGAYVNRGEELMAKRDYGGAAAQFELGRELYPDDPVFGTMAGIAWYLLGKPDLARLEFERARGVPKGEAPTLFAFLGRVHYDAGDLLRALEVWEEGLSVAPDDKVLSELVSRARRDLAVEKGMATGNSSRFIISYDGSVRPEAALLVLDELETALNSIGSDLGWYPENPIPVILYTREDYHSVTDTPDWSGGSYDGKIRLPVGGLKAVSLRLRSILRHEYTHVAVNALTLRNSPVWLNEGLAEYEGRKAHDVPLADLQNVLAKGAANLAPPAGSFSGLKGDEARTAYEVSHSLVSHMVRSYGMHKLRDLLVELGKGKKLAEAAQAAFSDLGLTFDDVLKEWRQGLVP
jgi:tetratricopeptide (TPR) repeat protein